MRHATTTHQETKNLRKAGLTHREICKKLGISLGSAHLWTKNIVITPGQKQAIEERRNAHAFSPERREKLRKHALAKLVPQLEKYTKEDLLAKIRNFYEVNERIPLKREFNMYHEYKRRFGSWNRAIRLAGFEPNPVTFAYKFVAKDTHRCDSFTEKIIDDWLSSRNIQHERHYRYGNTKMTADFFVKPNVIIEFFGLAGVQKNYDRMIEKKREFCGSLGLRLVEIYPKDLFPKNCLKKLIVF